MKTNDLLLAAGALLLLGGTAKQTLDKALAFPGQVLEQVPQTASQLGQDTSLLANTFVQNLAAAGPVFAAQDAARSLAFTVSHPDITAAVLGGAASMNAAHVGFAQGFTPNIYGIGGYSKAP